MQYFFTKVARNATEYIFRLDTIIFNILWADPEKGGQGGQNPPPPN